MTAILSGLFVNAVTPLLIKFVYTNTVKDLLVKVLRASAARTETKIDDKFVDEIVKKLEDKPEV